MPQIAEGNLVTYTHPAWGACLGRVLVVEPERVLVQDQHEHGAREWWPRAKCAVVVDLAETHSRRAR